MSIIKTPQQIASERLDALAQFIPLDADAIAFWTTQIIAAIDDDRTQRTADLTLAKSAITASYDAADGDSNDEEIQILQECRDELEHIVNTLEERSPS